TNPQSLNFYAANGATLNLPGITSFASNTFSNHFEADSGATINLPNLSVIHGATNYNALFLETYSGGVINANALTSIPDGTVWIRAHDSGGAINLNALTT